MIKGPSTILPDQDRLTAFAAIRNCDHQCDHGNGQNGISTDGSKTQPAPICTNGWQWTRVDGLGRTENRGVGSSISDLATREKGPFYGSPID